MTTIILPTFNGEKHIRQQINSILMQTDQDFKIIISDDCSTDNTQEILKELSSRDSRISVIINEQNLGLRNNISNAVAMVSPISEFIAFCDQDDIWEDNHLELLIENIGTKLLCCGNSTLYFSNDRIYGKTLSYYDAFDYVPTDGIKQAMRLFLFYNPYQGAAMLGRTDFIKKAMPVPEGIGYHDCWLAAIACMHGGINYVKKPILKYRRFSNSLTGPRDKRLSKIWYFRTHWIIPSRKRLAEKILQKYPGLPKQETRFLQHIIIMCEENNTKIGKIKNAWYKLKNYKYVYSCDLLHWL